MRLTIAQYPGWCPLCRDRVEKGERLVRWQRDWAHAECARAQIARAAILEGHTFAGQRASEYRRRMRRRD